LAYQMCLFAVMRLIEKVCLSRYKQGIYIKELSARKNILRGNMLLPDDSHARKVRVEGVTHT